MNRFFVEPQAVGNKVITIENKDDVHHIKTVLRLSCGDEIEISDSNEWEYIGRISYLGDRVEADILDKQRFTTEPSVKVTLFQGIPKQGKMDLTVQKAVELGVSQIVPVFMDRTVVKDKGNFWKRVIRFRAIAQEAAKQSKRGLVPDIRKECEMSEIYPWLSRFDVVIFPYEDEKDTTIKEVLKNFCGGAKELALMIGPEGGFSQDEAKNIVALGGKSCSLGKTILRTETAGIAALSMIMYELELG